MTTVAPPDPPSTDGNNDGSISASKTKGRILTTDKTVGILSIDLNGELMREYIDEAREVIIDEEIDETGYIWKYEIDVPEWVKGGSNNPAQLQLQRKTFLRVVLSEVKDNLEKPTVFRLLHDYSRKGEKLAVTMAVVATIKEALIHRKKVQIYGTVREEETEGLLDIKSDPFLEIRSVTIEVSD